MPLAPGTRLGPYEILSDLGAGGMGDVYRAHDTRLGREVAIKVSKEQFSERFDREARAVAALNHPNICHLYDVGANYLVMELIEGPTLAGRIAEGAIPLDEALPIARQIADALEAAHDKGIVHRDLKPGNIKVKPDGSVKVLDFGLAKLVSEASPLTSDSPTALASATRMGTILGTAAYMAPEQARGRVVDKRADIWAFGVVLYEMLTGTRLFQGEDVTETLAAVVKDQPDLSNVPPQVRRLLRKCLEKDPKKRLRDISGIELLLEETETPVLLGPASRRWWLWPAAGVLVAASAWIPWRAAKSSGEADRPVQRLDVDLGKDFEAGKAPGSGSRFAISPDGGRLVYMSRSRLFSRLLDRSDSIELNGAEGASAPFFFAGRDVGGFLCQREADEKRDVTTRLTFDGKAREALVWSPDGRFIVFASHNGILWTRADGGGKPQLLHPGNGAELAWSFAPDGKTLAISENGTFANGPNSDIWTLPVESDAAGLHAGKPEVFLQTPFQESRSAFSPDGRWLAYSSNEAGGAGHGVYVRGFPDRGGKWQVAGHGDFPRWFPNGHYLSFMDSAPGKTIFKVSYSAHGDSFAAEKASVWIPAQNKAIVSYDIASDGQRAVVLQRSVASEPALVPGHLTFLIHFADELARRAPATR